MSFDQRPDNEIISEISYYNDKINEDPNNLTNVSKYSFLTFKDQYELQRRILERSAKNSEKVERIAIGIAILSLILTIWFSYSSSRLDDEWKNEELRVLTEIKNK